MPLFRYTALSADGEELVGEMEAATEAAVLGRLATSDIFRSRQRRSTGPAPGAEVSVPPGTAR